jgi:Transcriptional regulator, AbiEi antitoxin
MLDHLVLPDHPFTLSDLTSLGLTRHRLHALLRTGEVRRVLRGVYAPATLEDIQATRAAALALVVDRHCVVTDQAAAWLHGISCYEPSDLDVLPPLQVVSTDGRERRRRAELLGGTRDLRPDEVMELDGVLVTTPLRTVCDLACLRGRGSAMAALDAFTRAFALTPRDFVGILPRFRRRRGCRQLRDLVPRATPLAESPGESWTRLAILDAGLPAPSLQWGVELPAYGAVRLDLAYPHLKIAVEYDGEEFHGAAHRGHDARRRAALRREGWCVIVVTKKDLGGPRLDAWLALLRTEIEARRPAPKRRYARGPE